MRISWMTQCPALGYLVLRSHECSEWEFHLLFWYLERELEEQLCIISVGITIYAQTKIMSSNQVPQGYTLSYGEPTRGSRESTIALRGLTAAQAWLSECFLQLNPAVFVLLLLLIAEVGWQSGYREHQADSGFDTDWVEHCSLSCVCLYVTCTETASASLLIVTVCSCPLARPLALLARISASLLLSSLYRTSSLSEHTKINKTSHIFLLLKDKKNKKQKQDFTIKK